jgi:hypothetical protein
LTTLPFWVYCLLTAIRYGFLYGTFVPLGVVTTATLGYMCSLILEARFVLFAALMAAVVVLKARIVAEDGISTQ